MYTITGAVGEHSYPGRGILLGLDTQGTHAVCAYFIMGRSENSRNRVFVAEGDGLRTQAYEPSRLRDPSLILYAPVRVLDGLTIVTNGDQTDTICHTLQQGGTFADALRTRTYEPDEPNWTPRISGLLRTRGGCAYSLSILKRAQEGNGACLRFFYEYEAQPGVGHFLHTYAQDGDPLPPYVGEPKTVALAGGLDAVCETIWDALDAHNRVSLFVRTVALDSGAVCTRIVNQNA